MAQQSEGSKNRRTGGKPKGSRRTGKKATLPDLRPTPPSSAGLEAAIARASGVQFPEMGAPEGIVGAPGGAPWNDPNFQPPPPNPQLPQPPQPPGGPQMNPALAGMAQGGAPRGLPPELMALAQQGGPPGGPQGMPPGGQPPPQQGPPPELTNMPQGPSDMSPQLLQAAQQGMGPQPQQSPRLGEDGTVGGMNLEFANRYQALLQAVREKGGEIYMYEGPRTPEQQEERLKRETARYGDIKEAMKRVKPPGKSSHDPSYGNKFGLGPGALGADLRGDLQLAYELAPQFGLVFSSKSQPWHIELAGLDQLG